MHIYINNIHLIDKSNDYKILSGIFDNSKIILNTSSGLFIGSWTPV